MRRRRLDCDQLGAGRRRRGASKNAVQRLGQVRSAAGMSAVDSCVQWRLHIPVTTRTAAADGADDAKDGLEPGVRKDVLQRHGNGRRLRSPGRPRSADKPRCDVGLGRIALVADRYSGLGQALPHRARAPGPSCDRGSYLLLSLAIRRFDVRALPMSGTAADRSRARPRPLGCLPGRRATSIRRFGCRSVSGRPRASGAVVPSGRCHVCAPVTCIPRGSDGPDGER
jgi:hypothetical protein